MLLNPELCQVFPIALIVMPIYLALPAVYYFFIYVGWRRKVMDDHSFSMRWGYLLDPYERK